MQSNFQTCLKLVLAHEGGFVDHPRDKGGATNKGVTQAVYDAFRVNRRQQKQSVKYITNDELTAIYSFQYWGACCCDVLPIGLDYAVFDFAVNSGPARAARYLQRLVGVQADGVIGNISLAAINKAYSAMPAELVRRYCQERLEFMQSLSNWDAFGKGWTRRVMGNKAGAQPGRDAGVIDVALHMIIGNLAALRDAILTPVVAPKAYRANEFGAGK